MKHLVLILVCMLSTAASADEFSSLTLASNLGDILASEEPCGLHYNQEAIETFIQKNVDEGDMGFTGSLGTYISYYKTQIDEMKPSQKTAHCAQVIRVTKKYNFTK